MPLEPITLGSFKLLFALAKADPAFRRSLLDDTATALRGQGLRPEPQWVIFFDSLTEANFEARMSAAAATLDAEARG
ncbi:hypothetical protein GXW74_19240 [Roseomonas eburnea]|uniref:Uncharacterized protein n=1 Tax=Neoroseomonas eburnea TaxID=1346889 RepID=A0A9X9XG00_9PROT|nr:hypothetical protein [Neoroseomonas eburnea]MBR0682636.1 hypothetical protein [Neoroseomonas eburnea]